MSTRDQPRFLQFVARHRVVGFLILLALMYAVQTLVDVIFDALLGPGTPEPWQKQAFDALWMAAFIYLAWRPHFTPRGPATPHDP